MLACQLFLETCSFPSDNLVVQLEGLFLTPRWGPKVLKDKIYCHSSLNIQICCFVNPQYGRPEVIFRMVSDCFPDQAVSNRSYFFLKHFSGPESGILEFDWLLTRVPPVQFFPIRTGFVMVTARINRAKTIE